VAVKIRLKRMGAKRDPFYRIVVSDARSPRDGRFIEQIGYYDPLEEPARISVDEAKARVWLQQGAQMTETVRSLFKKSGVLERLGAERAEERG